MSDHVIAAPCDCACCRQWAEVTRREVDAWRTAANKHAPVTVHNPHQLTAVMHHQESLLERARTDFADAVRQRDVWESTAKDNSRMYVAMERDRDTVRMLLDAAELRCQSLDRELVKVTEEMRDMAAIAESIVTTPTTPDARVEEALAEALAIIARIAPQCPDYTRADAKRVRELKVLVPS